MRTSTWALLGILTVAASSCGGHDDESPDAEACEHLEGGPAAPVGATASAMGAPAVQANHTRYDVTLVDVSGGKGGAVTFAAGEATDFAFFLNADVPLKLLDASGTEAPAESTATSSTACAQIKRKHVVPLKVGSYAVTFGPTSVDKVALVIEEAAHDH